MSVTPPFWQRTCIAGCTVFVLAAHVAQAQTPAGPVSAVAPPPATPVQDAAAQQIRSELDRLRQEFESVRDTYGARLSALEARLAQLQEVTAPAEAPVVPPAPPPVTAPAEAPQRVLTPIFLHRR